ncbi:MAG TPA: hypothetical protein VFM23_09760 [Gemmatimonadales bacterium]|nr:hypothetical protein [Gemmatimonadales bacterium]
MTRRPLYLLAAVACLATAPVLAQEPAAPPAREQAPLAGPGPRLDPGFKSFEPRLAQQEHALSAAAAADRTVITISTLGLVLLVVLLIVLLA